MNTKRNRGLATVLIGVFLVFSGFARIAGAQTAAANAAGAEAAKPGTAIELFVELSEDAFAEESVLKELTDDLRSSMRTELEENGFTVTMLDAPAQAAAKAPYLLKVRLIDYRTIGVQRAIYARYELIGGGKIVKQKLTQSTVREANLLPKALARQIAGIVRDRVHGAQGTGQDKKP